MEISIDISVVLITYRHEKYIANALDSILMQKSSLSIEVLVGEDNSPDDTAQILRQYEKMYPGRITVIYNSKNIGASRNLFNLLCRAKGRYIAMLEGDDYWLDESRLQVLYEFLENNSEYEGVSHRRERRNQDGEVVGYDPKDKVVGQAINLRKYHRDMEFSIMGCMFKNCFLENSSVYLTAVTAARNACDCVIAHIVLNRGPVFVLENCLGVYRELSGESNYCSNTRQDKVELDSIAEYRAIVRLFGNSLYYRKKISTCTFNALMFLIKRKMNIEKHEFWQYISFWEKIMFLLFFPYNLTSRALLHIKGRFSGHKAN